jgi:hypothetical protein
MIDNNDDYERWRKEKEISEKEECMSRDEIISWDMGTDDFASEVLPVITKIAFQENWPKNIPDWRDEIAMEAYKISDAMMRIKKIRKMRAELEEARGKEGG